MKSYDVPIMVIWNIHAIRLRRKSGYTKMYNLVYYYHYTLKIRLNVSKTIKTSVYIVWFMYNDVDIYYTVYSNVYICHCSYDFLFLNSIRNCSDSLLFFIFHFILRKSSLEYRFSSHKDMYMYKCIYTYTYAYIY